MVIGDLLRGGLKDIGVLNAGEAMPDGMGADALESLVMMLDDWSTDQLLVPVTNVVSHTLIAGQPEYTIGITGAASPPANHIETARPLEIVTAFIRDGAGTDYILEWMAATTYARISRKVNESRPSRFYYRQGWPTSDIIFESTPYASETLMLEVVQPLSELIPAMSITEEVSLPPGYLQTIRKSLGIVLANEYGKDVDRDTGILATQGKKRIKRQNYRPLISGMDRAVATKRRGIGTYIIDQGP